jgi:DNA-binding GntR family transcriptional regulator
MLVGVTTRSTRQMTNSLLPPSPIAQIEHVDLNEKVYEQLRRALLSGALPAGARLNLATLADQLGVSRSPTHQALTRLAAEGLVTVRSRRGYEVTPVTPEAVKEEYDIRLALELFAAERTVGRLTDDQLAAFGVALQRTLTPLQAEPVDLSGFIETNQDFHSLQLGFAANPTMTSVYGNLRVMLLMERLLAELELDHQRTAEICEQHVALYAAFAEGDLAAAQRTIRAHLELGRSLALEAIDLAGGGR